jgi:hypothetical protein
VIVLNCETVYLANLFGGEYGLHKEIISEPQINADKRRYKKSGLGRPACLPAAAPTVHFSRILNLYIQWTSISREFKKKILEQAPRLFQN